eukprot:bmy_07604T0
MDGWRAGALGPSRPMNCPVPTDLGQLQGDPEPTVVAAAQASTQQVVLLARVQHPPCRGRLLGLLRLPCVGRPHAHPAQPPPVYRQPVPAPPERCWPLGLLRTRLSPTGPPSGWEPGC